MAYFPSDHGFQDTPATAPDTAGAIPIVDLLDAPNGKFVERVELHEIDRHHRARIRIVRRAAAPGTDHVVVLGRWMTVPALNLGFGRLDRAAAIAAARARAQSRASARETARQTTETP